MGSVGLMRFSVACRVRAAPPHRSRSSSSSPSIRTSTDEGAVPIGRPCMPKPSSTTRASSRWPPPAHRPPSRTRSMMSTSCFLRSMRPLGGMWPVLLHIRCLGYNRRMKTGRIPRVWIAAAAIALLTITTGAQERDRANTPDQYKWNLADLYPNEAAWRAAKEKLAADIPQIKAFEGKLASSASTLADALDKQYALDKELSRLYVYASLLADQDTRDSGHQGMQQEMVQLASTFAAQASFIEPELLRAGKPTIDGFLAASPRLKGYRFYLEAVLRPAPHTLPPNERKILARPGPLAGAPSNAFNILSNADFPYPTVTLSDGRSVKLDQAAFSDLRALPNRADREKVMSAFFTALGGFSRTFGTTMNGEVQKGLFFTKSRRYNTALETELDAPNIPTSVYMRLIDGVNRNLPSFHRYLKLRQRMMGLGSLHYSDLYAPLVSSVKFEYRPEEAQKLVLGAVALLGRESRSASHL